jgi:2-C-methyl-D-erythritol 4-phosphate cytidylyltransferase/2-C-methyl-D-erythritol 2,4-cyclodiphosphate synthase
MINNKIATIIVASGIGNRFSIVKKDNNPKQYIELNSEDTVISMTIKKFLKNPRIHKVLVVINEKHINLFNESLKKITEYNEKLLPFVIGGETRKDSVYNALKKLNEEEIDYVLIHDSVRPLVCDEIINNVIDNLEKDLGVIPIIPMNDSLKKVENNKIIEHRDRKNLFLAQTPQGFNLKQILKAHEYFNYFKLMLDEYNAHDDSSIFEAYGLQNKTINGDIFNIKITYPEDLIMVKNIVNKSNLKIGQGFDIHSFASGRKLILGGVEIPYDKGLMGHSDADVLIHSIADAILGAMGLPDIGEMFPDNDSNYKNCSSLIFLERILQILNEKKVSIINIDATLLMEEPKIFPYKQLMQENIANALNISINNVNIKATTMEKLGSIGNKEGVASIANVLLSC